MESKKFMLDSDVHNDTAKDVDDPSSEKDEIPCYSSGNLLCVFYLISMLYNTLDC